MHAIEYDEIHDEIVAPQQFAQAILTFRGAASGEEPPIRVIQGNLTQLKRPDRLAIDPVNNEILVPSGDRVLVFPRSAHGNVQPVRVLMGPDTQLGASAVAVDPVNNLLVVAGSRRGARGQGTRSSNDDEDGGQRSPSHLLVFKRTAEGNARPLRVITGPKTLLVNTKNVRVHPPTGFILIARDGTEGPEDGISFVGVWSIHDDGDVAPRWTIGGPGGMLSKPRGLDLDPANETVIISDKDLNGAVTYHVPEIFRKAPSIAPGGGLTAARGQEILGRIAKWLRPVSRPPGP